MTTEKPPVDERDAEGRLRQTMLSVRVALDLFEERVEDILSLQETVTDAQASKAITRLKETFIALNRERQTFEKEFYGRSGPVGAEPIDFEAARSEIGRLLDRLRTAGDAGRVSEEPQP